MEGNSVPESNDVQLRTAADIAMSGERPMYPTPTPITQNSNEITNPNNKPLETALDKAMRGERPMDMYNQTQEENNIQNHPYNIFPNNISSSNQSVNTENVVNNTNNTNNQFTIAKEKLDDLAKRDEFEQSKLQNPIPIQKDNTEEKNKEQDRQIQSKLIDTFRKLPPTPDSVEIVKDIKKQEKDNNDKREKTLQELINKLDKRPTILEEVVIISEGKKFDNGSVEIHKTPTSRKNEKVIAQQIQDILSSNTEKGRKNGLVEYNGEVYKIEDLEKEIQKTLDKTSIKDNQEKKEPYIPKTTETITKEKTTNKTDKQELSDKYLEEIVARLLGRGFSQEEIDTFTGQHKEKDKNIDSKEYREKKLTELEKERETIWGDKNPKELTQEEKDRLFVISGQISALKTFKTKEQWTKEQEKRESLRKEREEHLKRVDEIDKELGEEKEDKKEEIKEIDKEIEKDKESSTEKKEEEIKVADINKSSSQITQNHQEEIKEIDKELGENKESSTQQKKEETKVTDINKSSSQITQNQQEELNDTQDDIIPAQPALKQFDKLLEREQYTPIQEGNEAGDRSVPVIETQASVNNIQNKTEKEQKIEQKSKINWKKIGKIAAITVAGGVTGAVTAAFATPAIASGALVATTIGAPVTRIVSSLLTRSANNTKQKGVLSEQESKSVERKEKWANRLSYASWACTGFSIGSAIYLHFNGGQFGYTTRHQQTITEAPTTTEAPTHTAETPTQTAPEGTIETPTTEVPTQTPTTPEGKIEMPTTPEGRIETPTIPEGKIELPNTNTEIPSTNLGNATQFQTGEMWTNIQNSAGNMLGDPAKGELFTNEVNKILTTEKGMSPIQNLYTLGGESGTENVKLLNAMQQAVQNNPNADISSLARSFVNALGKATRNIGATFGPQDFS